MELRLRGAMALTALKLMIIPAYRSTDFEVHRNWLAVTSSLPINNWYTDATSGWTLDYPPLFAWFEWLLAQLARFVDPAMLQVSSLNYASPATILFQRGSVIVTDGVLLGAAWYATRSLGDPKRSTAFLLVTASAGLLVVDHIHFQYNGFLLGILLWSMALMQERQHLLGAALFALLLNMKHLFACLGPLYFVYLLRHHCRGKHAVWRFVQLGAMVAAICTASFSPFLMAGQLPQVLGRLFPLQRGLVHAYWAANCWAVYSTADKALAAVLLRLGHPINTPTAQMTGTHMPGGLVRVSSFAVLPNVEAGSCALLALAAMVPMLAAVWRRANVCSFPAAAAYSCLCSFMLGYHVHEKAILMALLPLALDTVGSAQTARSFILLSVTGHYSLLPLLFSPNEYPIKVLIFLLYSWGSYAALHHCHCTVDAQGLAVQAAGSYGRNQELLSRWDKLYLLGLGGLGVYCAAFHAWVAPRLAFLPLMLTSVYCALGLAKDWFCLGMQLSCAPMQESRKDV